jgi:hypothetical protein
MRGKPQKNAIGVKIILTVKNHVGAIVQLDGVTKKDMRFIKPGGAELIKTSVPFSTDGKDGKIEYVTASGDLDTAGVWKVQAILKFPGTGAFDGASGFGEFVVQDNC